MSRQTLFFIPRPVDPTSLSCKYPSAHKPYFSYHVLLTQLRSHASVLWPITLISHTRPVDPASLSWKYPSAHKPYFSYQLFERMPRPIDSGSFPYKRPLNSNHPVHCTFLIWSHFIYWTQLIALRPFSCTHATLIKFYSYKPNELPSSRSIPSKRFHPAFWIMYCLCHLIR